MQPPPLSLVPSIRSEEILPNVIIIIIIKTCQSQIDISNIISRASSKYKKNGMEANLRNTIFYYLPRYEMKAGANEEKN